MITKKEAVSFLKAHQPMPSDDELQENDIKKYAEIRDYFIKNPDEQCISLFLNSFGGKDGYGVYQMVEDVILMYDIEKVVPHLLKTFDSVYEGVKYWGIQISSNYPSEKFFEPLVDLLKSEDEDIKFATITTLARMALNNINKQQIINILKKEYEILLDEDIKEFIIEVLFDITNSNL
ncbi:MAG: hypothetical protein IJC76_07895 [Lachnospiraceae bacterium]|nr:hypothetical protein [Lachnospiraceae bacterium]